MKYIGINCPVCAEKFIDNDDVVVCPICGTPHHRHCWNENGKCINADKHNSGFIWQMPGTAPAQQKSTNEVNGDYKLCPRCGCKNSPLEPVCTSCGERLKANSQTIEDQMPFSQQSFGGYTNQNPNNSSPYQNVYAADARTVYGEAVIDDIPVTEAAEYIQKNSNLYIGKFLDMQDKKSKAHWNWSAGIFSVFWCFYRKMMAVGIALLALLFSALLLSSTVPAIVYEKYQPDVYSEYKKNTTEMYDMMTAIQNGETEDVESVTAIAQKVAQSPITKTTYVSFLALTLIINITFGFFGNYFYKKRMVKDIHMLRQVSADSMTYHIYLRQRGGSSAINVLIPIIIYMAVEMFYTMI